MDLSKSKYCNALQCKKMLWLEKNKPNEKKELKNNNVFENGNTTHEVARYLFGEHINIEYDENLQEMINNTISTIESYQNIIITEASFNYNNNFCSVDILKKDNNKYEIYEVKSSTKLKDIYIKDISYQYYILTNLGLNVTKCSIIYINNKYIRDESINLEELFTINNVTKEVKELQEEVENNIIEINNYMKQTNEPKEDIDIKCFKPYPCQFFDYCKKHLQENNVFNISNMHISNKIKLYKQGKYDYESLLKENIDKKYKQQIEYELYNKEQYIDTYKIKEFINTLTYPLYFLDFETFQMPIPLYKGTSPYEQIPFQYSLHYIKKDNSKLNHLEFLSEPGIDPRRPLAERLVKDIPSNACILAYNMSFEKTIIKKLANTYPDLKDNLMILHDNIKDLMIPFKNRYYYDKNMKGSYSIKYVLPAIFPNEPSLDYHNLDLIHNGEEAMNNYANLETLSKEEQKYIKERLLRYCELDTYAMVKIYQKLKKI